MNLRRSVNSILLTLVVVLLSSTAVTGQERTEEETTESDNGLSGYIDQFQPRERVRLNIDLSHSDLEQLKRDGKLRLRIPEYYENKVAAILLRHVDSYMKEKVRVSGEPKVVEDASQVRLDELMLERLGYQPIEFRVFEKNFSEVEIFYVDEPQTKVFVAEDDQGLTREEYQIQINDRFHLNAKISSIEQIKLNTDFGKYEIAWSSIERIQFGEFGTASAKVFLKDGSAVSGHLEIETLDIKTRWGKITIPANDLSSISR